MMKQLFLLLLIATITYMACKTDYKTGQGANQSDTTTQLTKDSLELTTLTRSMYAWKQKTFGDSMPFSPLKMDPVDSLCHGIDFDQHHWELMQLEQSGFFATEFITTYQSIAVYIDRKLKSGSAKWVWGEIPPFPGYEGDPWCECQDFPNNWNWKDIVIRDIQIKGKRADFIWDGGKDFTYHLSAIKVNGVWKIAALAGFMLTNYKAYEG